mmetsp:Transcript_68501/g.201073  ORF Transcript_68501/g.201073 Transcript_68501/m.201073 type:complete len:316 (-) Transcript_68501:41-988(-)
MNRAGGWKGEVSSELVCGSMWADGDGNDLPVGRPVTHRASTRRRGWQAVPRSARWTLPSDGGAAPFARASCREEGLGALQPLGVLALLLVEGHSIDEVADLVAHAELRKVFVKSLLQLVIEVLELRAEVAADAILLGRRAEALHVADDVAVVLARVRAAVERHARAVLVLAGDAELSGLLSVNLAILALYLRIVRRRNLPLDADNLVANGPLQGHVDVAVRLDELEIRGLEEVLDLLGLLVLLLFVLQLGRQDLAHLLGRSGGDAPHRRRSRAPLREPRAADGRGHAGGEALPGGLPRRQAHGGKREGGHGDLGE